VSGVGALRGGVGSPYDPSVPQSKPLFESEPAQQAAVAVVMAAVLAGSLGIAWATPELRSALRAEDASAVRIGAVTFEVPGAWKAVDAGVASGLPGVEAIGMRRLPGLAGGPITLASGDEPWLMKIDAGLAPKPVGPDVVLNLLHRSGLFPPEGRERMQVVHLGGPTYFVIQAMISRPHTDGRRRVTVAAAVTRNGREHTLIVAQGVADPSRPLEQSRQLMLQTVYAAVASLHENLSAPG